MGRLNFIPFLILLALPHGLLANSDDIIFERGTKVIVIQDKNFVGGGQLIAGASATVLTYLPILGSYSLSVPCKINSVGVIFIPEEDLRLAQSAEEIISGEALCKGID